MRAASLFPLLFAIVGFSACVSQSGETQLRDEKLEPASEFGLKSFAGKVVVLNFWSSACTSCRIEAPELEKTWWEYRNKDVVIILTKKASCSSNST